MCRIIKLAQIIVYPCSSIKINKKSRLLVQINISVGIILFSNKVKIMSIEWNNYGIKLIKKSRNI